MKLFRVQLSHKEFLYKYLGTQLNGQHTTFGFDTLFTAYSSSGVKGRCHKKPLRGGGQSPKKMGNRGTRFLRKVLKVSKVGMKS